MFDLELMTFEGKRLKMDVKSIVIPTSDGNRTVLANHMDIMVEVVPGVFRIRTQTEVLSYFVSDGLVQFSDNKCLMNVHAFETIDEIDFERAHIAYDKAKKTLQDTDSAFELKKAEQALKRAIGRLRLE